MLFRYKNTSLIKQEVFDAKEKRLESYRDHLKMVVEDGGYTQPECSINLSSDENILSEVDKVLLDFDLEQLKYVIVVGVGGSNLGTKAVYDAIEGYYDSLSDRRSPKMIFIDTTDPRYLDAANTFLSSKSNNPSEILINIVSKSGTTTEAISNTELLFGGLDEDTNVFLKRTIVTTNENSPLWNTAKEKGLAVVHIPELVGGRYSVLTGVGLLPLRAAKIDVVHLLEGARAAREKCLSKIENNPAMLSAIILYHYLESNINIHNTFLFHPEFESIGKWYRQLMGESVGKDKDLSGKLVHTGITPIVSIGSTDLHSMSQLFLGGPRDKITTFVSSKSEESRLSIPVGGLFSQIVPMIQGKKAEHIMSGILEGVKKAYTKEKLPFMEVILDDVYEKSIGYFLQFKMIEMMYLAKLMNVNAFNQPNVEAYKSETRQILENN